MRYNYLLLLIFLFSLPCFPVYAENDQSEKYNKNAGVDHLSKEDLEIIKMMEILEMIDLIEEFDLLKDMEIIIEEGDDEL